MDELTNAGAMTIVIGYWAFNNGYHRRRRRIVPRIVSLVVGATLVLAGAIMGWVGLARS